MSLQQRIRWAKAAGEAEKVFGRKEQLKKRKKQLSALHKIFWMVNMLFKEVLAL
jgi:hypothetical protein